MSENGSSVSLEIPLPRVEPYAYQGYAPRERSTRLYLALQDQPYTIHRSRDPEYIVETLEEVYSVRSAIISRSVQALGPIDIERVICVHRPDAVVVEDQALTHRLAKLIRVSYFGKLLVTELEPLMRRCPEVAWMRYAMVFKKPVPAEIVTEIKAMAEIVVVECCLLAASEADLLMVRCYNELQVNFLYDFDTGQVITDIRKDWMVSGIMTVWSEPRFMRWRRDIIGTRTRVTVAS